MKRIFPASLLRAGALGALALCLSGLSSLPTGAAEPKRVLVVTVTKDFRHDSIPTAMNVIADLGRQSKAYTVDFAFNDQDLATKMTAENLMKYDGFIFANTTGVLPLPDKDAFLNAIKAGKGFAGMHSASDTFHDKDKDKIDPYIEMVGGEFLTHGAQAGVECLVEDRTHPATKMLGESLCIGMEEIYLFKSYDPTKVRELLVLDRHPNKKKELGRFPVAWCKQYGEGRVFYTSLGHREDVWLSEPYKKHILGGIKWSLGLEPGDATPQAK